MQLDTLTNLVSALGTSRDKTSHDRFELRPLADHEIDALADGDWIAAKILTLPVQDTMRAWRTWSAPGRAVDAFEAAERRHGVKDKITEALYLARRYGGSAILIGADVERPDLPLRPAAVKRGGLAYLTVLKHREIIPGPPVRDIRSPDYGRPSYYDVTPGDGGHVRVHPSRVLRFIGARRVDVYGEALGWGYSALQAPYDAIHHTALALASGAVLMHEAKVDVVTTRDLASALQTTEGTDALMRRFGLAATMKSTVRTLLLGEGETYNQVSHSFAGVPQMLEAYLSVAAAAADIPASRFLSRSPAGLSGTGHVDTRHYYDRLASERAATIVPVLDRLDAILWRDATGRGAPRGAHYTWDPLWQLTDAERVETAGKLASAISTLASAAVLDEDALAIGARGALIETGLFPGLDIDLDSEADDDDDRAPGADDPAGEIDEPDSAPASRADRRYRAAARAADRRGRSGALSSVRCGDPAYA